MFHGRFIRVGDPSRTAHCDCPALGAEVVDARGDSQLLIQNGRTMRQQVALKPFLPHISGQASRKYDRNNWPFSLRRTVCDIRIEFGGPKSSSDYKFKVTTYWNHSSYSYGCVYKNHHAIFLMSSKRLIRLTCIEPWQHSSQHTG